jgi:hypothetical protein
MITNDLTQEEQLLILTIEREESTYYLVHDDGEDNIPLNPICIHIEKETYQENRKISQHYKMTPNDFL